MKPPVAMTVTSPAPLVGADERHDHVQREGCDGDHQPEQLSALVADGPAEPQQQRDPAGDQAEPDREDADGAQPVRPRLDRVRRPSGSAMCWYGGSSVFSDGIASRKAPSPADGLHPGHPAPSRRQDRPVGVSRRIRATSVNQRIHDASASTTSASAAREVARQPRAVLDVGVGRSLEAGARGRARGRASPRGCRVGRAPTTAPTTRLTDSAMTTTTASPSPRRHRARARPRGVEPQGDRQRRDRQHADGADEQPAGSRRSWTHGGSEIRVRRQGRPRSGSRARSDACGPARPPTVGP